MNKSLPLLPLLPLLLLAACAGRPEIRLTSEPSIERAFDILNSAPEGKPLVEFLYKHPVRFEYANTPGLCHKFSLKTGKIFLPAEYKNSDLVLALAAARAAYIYRLYSQTGLDEIISEEEELGTLYQARVALEIDVLDADFKKAKAASEIKTDFCTYILENSAYAMEQTRKEVLTPDADCQRPLDTLENQRAWLEKIRQAINDETFYQLLYERDMQRVRKGAIKMSEAMGNDARTRGLPIYEVYRYQRTFYDRQSDIFRVFKKAYAREIEEDADWRQARQDVINSAREEFSACNLP